MFCRKCGEEINDEAVICPKCGCETGFKSKQESQDQNESKTDIGVVLGLFLGLIGLIIGLCLYKDGTIARKTFLKAWGITVGVSIVAGIILYVVVFSVLMNSYNQALNHVYYL